WNSAVVLSRWIVLHTSSFSGRDVIELGCGTGLAGITCALTGARSVVLSDHHDLVLKYAQENIALNRCETVASVLKLDWNTVVKEEGGSGEIGKYDVVVGSDICYDPDHPALLGPCIRKLLRSGVESYCYLAVMRDRPEIRLFEDEMV